MLTGTKLTGNYYERLIWVSATPISLIRASGYLRLVAVIQKTLFAQPRLRMLS